jgi:hypothetical protein
MKIKKGTNVLIDKGILGLEYGTICSINGVSCGGFWGFYKNQKGEKHIFDETIHKLMPARSVRAKETGVVRSGAGR